MRILQAISKRTVMILARTPLSPHLPYPHLYSHTFLPRNSNTTTSFKPPAAVRTHDPESPQFRHFDQSTNLELFYDLFFVANLTVFTYEHEVNDGESLKQYVGFFCIIWFTWYQVSLYDVRFFMDSVFERVCMAVQFL